MIGMENLDALKIRLSKLEEQARVLDSRRIEVDEEMASLLNQPIAQFPDLFQLEKASSVVPQQLQIREGYVVLPSGLKIAEKPSLYGLDWERAMIASYSDGGNGATTPAEELDFLFYLSQFSDDARAKAILDDSFGKREPWRGVHLSTRVVQMKDGFGDMGLEFVTGVKDDQLVTERKLLDPCLMNDCYTNFRPESFNPQGLAETNAKAEIQEYIFGETIKFHYPRVGCVAGLDVDSGCACLDFGRNPQDSIPRLGVRLKCA